jgi:hypothetical protein
MPVRKGRIGRRLSGPRRPASPVTGVGQVTRSLPHCWRFLLKGDCFSVASNKANIVCQ